MVDGEKVVSKQMGHGSSSLVMTCSSSSSSCLLRSKMRCISISWTSGVMMVCPMSSSVTMMSLVAASSPATWAMMNAMCLHTFCRVLQS